ncbi:MAG: hypothetical protein HYV28_05740 [Ignavibacteriales bacterium]|nr:hypothetical protein [Ignavibacteriales bacterium]
MYHCTRYFFIFFTMCFVSLFAEQRLSGTAWLAEKHKTYNVFFTETGKASLPENLGFINNGIFSVVNFFGNPFPNKFDFFIHPDRNSIDSTWQVEWKMPDFKSECWMVASGVATRLDIILPQTWDTTSCEHRYANAMETQKLITHELVHVFHGQYNISPDFSDVDGIDWFVEGLATYASGQCDSARMAQVKKAVTDSKAPGVLDKFWTGKLRYGLSGSMVMYLDRTYGRKQLIELLRHNKKEALLSALNITEENLLMNWKGFVSQFAR